MQVASALARSVLSPYSQAASVAFQAIGLTAPLSVGALGYAMGLAANALAKATNLENGFKVTASLDKPPTFEALPDDLPNDYPNPGGTPGTPDNFPNTPPPGTRPSYFFGTPATTPANEDTASNKQTGTTNPSTINNNNNGGGRDDDDSGGGTTGDYGGDGADGGGGTQRAPVVLDLDGDGVELLDLTESNAFFDLEGDGFLRLTSWVAADDALLAYDKNSDGVIRDADEISFVSYLEGDETDLEGLKAFDTNNDNVLNAQDEEWDKFGAWQDRNGDGHQDDGEFLSLEERGIAKINLVSDSNSYLDGTSLVFGKSSYTTVDNSRFVIADVAFLALPLGIKPVDREQNIYDLLLEKITSCASSEKETLLEKTPSPQRQAPSASSSAAARAATASSEEKSTISCSAEAEQTPPCISTPMPPSKPPSHTRADTQNTENKTDFIKSKIYSGQSLTIF